MKRCAAVLTVAVTCLACGEEDAPVTTSAPVQRPEISVVAEPEPTPVTSIYSYAAVGKKDPFRPFFHSDDDVKPGDHPLARYELEELRLTAVIVGTATPAAMIEDPTGNGHVVRVGMLIGKSGALVKHIRRGEIILEQRYTTFDLRPVTTLTPMKLEGEPG